MSDKTFSEAGPNFDPDRLDKDQRRTYDAANASLQKEFSPDKETATIMGFDGIKAGYKIEIMFGPKRTPAGPNKCVIQIWESGKRLDGDADDLMFWCRDVDMKSGLGCGKPIPAGAVHALVAICPTCQMAIRADKLTQQQFHHITTQNLATLLESMFHDLKDNADIYCKYDQSDIRYQACMREKGFEKARYLRGLFIYPLKNILKDTSAGSSLAARFKAFLSA